MISGFSVAFSYEKSGRFGSYINSRLWRIAPLYYFWLVTAVLLGVTATFWQQEFDLPDISVWNWLLHVSFLSFLDYRIANSIIGVEWSIPIEVFWYFFTPALLLFARTGKRLLILLLIAYCIYQMSQTLPRLLAVDPAVAALAIHWSPLPYIMSFALGIAAYRLRPRLNASATWANTVLFVSLLLLSVHVMLPIPANAFYNEFLLISCLSAALLATGSQRSTMFRGLFCNRIAQLLGVISYGIYLSHVPLIGLMDSFQVPGMEQPFLRFVLVVAVSSSVSMATYLTIERGFNATGRLIAARYIARSHDRPSRKQTASGTGVLGKAPQ